MTEAKFTSFTTCDFLNDVDLDIFIDALAITDSKMNAIFSMRLFLSTKI